MEIEGGARGEIEGRSEREGEVNLIEALCRGCKRQEQERYRMKEQGHIRRWSPEKSST